DLVLHSDIKVNATNKDNKTAAKIASENKHEKLAQVLLAGEVFRQLPIVEFSELKIEKTLGEGVAGIASKATWHNTAVVVKQLKQREWTAENFMEFVNEAANSDKLGKHPNIGQNCFCVCVSHFFLYFCQC